MDPPLISLRGVSFGYPGRDPILDSLDFRVEEGARLALVGRNGSGKTPCSP